MAIFLAPLGLACASTGAAPSSEAGAWLPPSLQIDTWTEESRDGSSTYIYMKNNTGQTIRIRTLWLFECYNVRNACDLSTRVNYLIRPDETRRVMEVRPQLGNSAFSFRYRYSWEPYTPSE
jgi:hypothetical protein